MNITPDEFEKALAEFQAFGPRRRIDVEQRWRETLGIDPREFVAIKARCKEIESFAWGLADRFREKEISEQAGRQILAEKYPFLTQDSLARTWSQACYFSFK